MTTQLYLIRHGESVANVEPIIGGMRGDAGLTDRGREQAHLLEQRLRREKLRADQLYASTLPRAWETADYVARALRLPVQPAEELHELRPGDADGMTVDQWRDRYGDVDAPPARRTRSAPSLPGVRAGRRSSPAPVPPSPPCSIATRTKPSSLCATPASWKPRSTSRSGSVPGQSGFVRRTQHRHHPLAARSRTRRAPRLDDRHIQRRRTPRRRHHLETESLRDAAPSPASETRIARHG